MTTGPGWSRGDYLDRPLRELVGDVAGKEPLPAAGTLVAVTGVLAAGLTAKVARRSLARNPEAKAVADRADRLRERLEPVITRDPAAYADVLAARSEGRDVGEAMRAASAGPETVAEAASEVAALAAELAETGNPNLRYDAEAAARLATTASEVGTLLAAANQ